jgi:hypothetical protein
MDQTVPQRTQRNLKRAFPSRCRLGNFLFSSRVRRLRNRGFEVQQVQIVIQELTRGRVVRDVLDVPEKAKPPEGGRRKSGALIPDLE